MKKAQIWSADFSVSIVIFFLVMMFVIFAWSYLGFQNQQRMSFNQIENTALIVSDSLVRTAGEPESWNESSVETIGLASEENILDPGKVDSFINMGYDETLSVLGTGGNFYFELRDISNNLIQNSGGQNITKGVYPPGNATMVVPVERYCIYDQEIAKLIFVIWF